MKIGDPRLGPQGDASATASNPKHMAQDAEDKKTQHMILPLFRRC